MRISPTGVPDSDEPTLSQPPFLSSFFNLFLLSALAGIYNYEIDSHPTGRLDSKLLAASMLVEAMFFQVAEDSLDAEFWCQARKRHFSSQVF